MRIAMEARQSELEGQLAEERKMRKAAERKTESLQEKLDYSNQERFGDRRQQVRNRTTGGDLERSESDRENEKDKFDGTADSLSTDSVDSASSGKDTDKSKKDRDLSNRPDEYKKMGVVGDPVFHPSDLSKVPGRIIERKTVRVFSLRMSLVEERFEMVHYAVPGQKPQWGYFPREGHPGVVTRFEGTKATPEFLQALAYEVYVKNVTVNKTQKVAIFFYENGSRGRDVLTDFLGDSELKSLMSDEYNAYVFIGDELKSVRFKDTVHQVCMSHCNNKFVKAAN